MPVWHQKAQHPNFSWTHPHVESNLGSPSYSSTFGLVLLNISKMLKFLHGGFPAPGTIYLGSCGFSGGMASLVLSIILSVCFTFM